VSLPQPERAVGREGPSRRGLPDVERVSPEHIEQLVGGFTDDGPPVSAYAAALVDETGELTLIGGPETPGFEQCTGA
jgi:hypothetical protein